MTSINSAYCSYCKKQVAAQKKSCNHVLHVILSLITMGFWLPVWLICALVGDEWHCPQCGKIVRLGTEAPENRCPECDEIIDEDIAFCPYCGKSIYNMCPKCNTRNPSEALYCKNCGEKLSAKKNKKVKKASSKNKSVICPQCNNQFNIVDKGNVFSCPKCGCQMKIAKE